MTVEEAATAAGEIGVLVMAYGTASGPDDIERYYTDIRGGRAPSPEHLQELRDRYAEIGNVFPLGETTRAQAEGLVSRLNADAEAPRFHAYLGMKHSPPFIADTVELMRRDGVSEAVGIVMAPHWSGMSVESYIERVKQAAQGVPRFTFVRSYSAHPTFIDLLASRVADALGTLSPEQAGNAGVIFSAHSLPVRTLPDGTQLCKVCDCETSCRYRDGLQETADLVAAKLELSDYAIAWQSAGRTPDPWWGPSVEEVIQQMAVQWRSAVVVCSAGFVADHLEILYDLDIEAAQAAQGHGLTFVRSALPNADPAFLEVLAAVVRQHLAAEAATT